MNSARNSNNDEENLRTALMALGSKDATTQGPSALIDAVGRIAKRYFWDSNPKMEDHARSIDEQVQSYLASLTEDSARRERLLSAPAGALRWRLRMSFQAHISETNPDQLVRFLKKAVDKIVLTNPTFETSRKRVRLAEANAKIGWPTRILRSDGKLDHAHVADAIVCIFHERGGVGELDTGLAVCTWSMTRAEIARELAMFAKALHEYPTLGELEEIDTQSASPECPSADTARHAHDARVFVAQVAQLLGPRHLALLEAKLLGESIEAAGERLGLGRRQSFDIARQAVEQAVDIARDLGLGFSVFEFAVSSITSLFEELRSSRR